jgi:hypothetical protein
METALTGEAAVVVGHGLVKLVSPHKTYVEPFAGSAAVFFEKPPCDTEVLGDADPEIASPSKRSRP